MQNIVEEASYEETEAEQVQSVLQGIAGYMICDILETIRELQGKDAIHNVDDVCDYLYGLFSD